MSTHNIHFQHKVRKYLYILVFLSCRKNVLRAQKLVRVIHGKRAIRVRATADYTVFRKIIKSIYTKTKLGMFVRPDMDPNKWDVN